MAKKVARSAIHAQPQTTFSPLQANENTRDKWDRSRYEKKNEDTSHHYDFTRKKLNFVVTADGIKPLDTTNKDNLYDRYVKRLAELKFKGYDPKSPNQPNSYIDWVFSGDHDAMAKLAFGDQKVDFSLKTSNAHVRRMPAFEQYARDVYDFACHKFGKENVVGVEAHLDETTPHVHVNVIPVAMRQQKGRASYLYVNRNDPSKTITSKDYKALNSQARKEWERSTQMERKEILAVSYSGLIGETRAERGKYLKQFHTDFYENVGKKYGLERGRPRETLSEEELKEVRHKTAAELEAERQEKIQELKELDEKIEEMQQNAGKGAKFLSWMGVSDTAYTKGKSDGVKETKEKIVQAAGLKIEDREAYDKLTIEQLGENIKDFFKAAGQRETMKTMTDITGAWINKEGKPYIPSPEEYAEHYKGLDTAKDTMKEEIQESVQKETILSILNTAKLTFGKDGKGNPLIPTPEDLGKDYRNKFDQAKDAKINSWLVRNLLHAPDRQLWNDMEFGQGQLNYRVMGSYAGIKFNCGFRDLDEATLPKILTNIQALPYDMATAADEGLRETVATVFMSYVSSQAPSGGGGGGSDDNWWKRKDEDWFKGAFNSVFRTVLPQVQNRKRK